MASNITRKRVNGKVYTYNSGKLIHVMDTGSGNTDNYDITKNNKQSKSTGSGSNTVKKTNNRNADGTWKNQTMVTGDYFGVGSKKETQPKNVIPSTPGLQTPQLRQVSVSNSDKKSKSNGMRERIAEKNKGKQAVAGKGYVDRGAAEKSYGGKNNSALPVLDTNNNIPGLGAPQLGDSNRTRVRISGGSQREAEAYGGLYAQMKGKKTDKKTEKGNNIGPYNKQGLKTNAENIKNSKVTNWAQKYASEAQVAKDVDAKYEATQAIQKEMDKAGYTKSEQNQIWEQIEKESGFKPQTRKSAFSRVDDLTEDKNIAQDIQKAAEKHYKDVETDTKELQSLSKKHSEPLNDAYANRRSVRSTPTLEERSKGQRVKSGSVIGEAVKNDPGLLEYIKKLAYSKSYYTDKEKQDAVTAWRMLTYGDRRQDAEALGVSLNEYNSLVATLSMRAREIEQGAYEGMAAIIPGYDYMQGGLDTDSFDLQKYLNGGYDLGTYYSQEEQKQIKKNIESMETAKSIGGTIGTVASMLMMNYGSAAINGAAQAGKIATTAGKTASKASRFANLILKGASKTGMPAFLTMMSASRKGYDWSNLHTDFIKNMIMLNVMGATESKITSALKGALSKSKYATSNLALTGIKAAGAAGGAATGVVSTIPFNSKEENEKLGEQWVTLTLYSMFNSVISGSSKSMKETEAGMATILNAEAEYKAALKEYIQNDNIESAIEHTRNARSLHNQGKEMLVGNSSEMMYGFPKSQKQYLMDAYDQIGQGLANLEIDLMADYPGSRAFGAGESSYRGQYMALPAGIGAEPTPLDSIQTPTLDQYAGGKGEIDAVLGRAPSGANDLPMIAKYGGSNLADNTNAVIKGSNVLALNTDSTPMITKYAGDLISNEIKEDVYLKAVADNNSEKASQLVAEKASQKGYNIEAYHGTPRADRVGDTFLPERATSGPMAFFTDSKEIADNYANDKRDTSLAYDDSYSDYYSQFRTNSNGVDVAISDTWRNLSSSKKADITERAKHITLDENGENIIYDPNTNNGLGNFDQYLLREHNGNAIEALIESWLVDGNLYGEEGRFKDVLKLAGIDDVQYLDPDYKEPKTYHVFLRIQNPFDTANVSEDLLTGIKEYAENNTGIFNKEYSGADLWDKNRWTVDEWVEKAAEDMQNGTTYAWTSIPDFVSGYLKELGYDGIKDLGGKYSGAEHTVYIPFASEQIKSAEPFEYDKNGDIIPLEKRFDDSELSIKYKLNNDNGGLSYNADPEVFDADEKWVGIRETGGYERLCESSASYEERLAAAENIRRSKSYEETSVVADDGSETTISIVTDESLLPEDARVQREYISNKYGLTTKYFLGGADADIAEGASLADAFVTSEGIVYLSLESKGMLSNGEHECFHWIYYANQEETDVFASNILALLNANNEYDAVMLDYSNEYWFYTKPNDVFQEVLADLYAGKLTLSDQGKVDEYIKDLKASIESGTAKQHADQKNRFHINKEVPSREDTHYEMQTPEEFQQTVNNSEAAGGPIQVGQATTIKRPYSGPTPVQIKTNDTRVDISDKNYSKAVKLISRAESQTDKSFKGFLTSVYNKIFDRIYKDTKSVPVNGLSFDGESYVISLGKKLVKKVVNDVNMSPEKLAVLENLEEIISNGNYVGSGEYGKTLKEKNKIRYDYFETPAEINNNDYVVAFDVEVTVDRNNYRTHKIIKEIDLINTSSADVAPTATAKEVKSSLSNDNVAQGEPEVNTVSEETAVSKPELKSKLSKQYDKAVKEFTDNAFRLMNVPNKKSVQADLKAKIEQIAANTFETGMVDNDAVTDLVARMWDAGQISENYIMDNFPELKEYFRKTAIKVSDAIQRDITDYNAWRKSQMGSLNITHKTGTPVDVIYQELNARYPELFPEDIINPTEQLMRMADIRQQMRGTTRSNSNLYTDEQRVEIASMANKLVDTLEKKLVGIAAESKGEAIPGYSPENLASLDAQDPLNQDPDWLSLQQTEPVAETEGEKLKNYKETRRRVNLTSQVLDMTRRVQKAAKKAQPELRAKMIEEFGTIVPYFKGMSDGKRINLKKQIDDLDRFRREVPGAKQYVWDSAAGTYKEDDPIMKIMNQLNGKLIAEMTNDELYQLFKNGQMMLHQLQTAKKEIREQGAREISDLSDNLVKQMKTAGPKVAKDNSVADFFTVKMLRPETFAKEVDGYAEDGVMQRLVEDIREGQTKAIDFKNRANDLFEDFADRNKKLIEKEWAGKKAKWHDTGVVPINGSETIKLTPGLRIAVYLNSLDYDAMRHMVGGQYRGDDGKMHVYDGGGITVPDQKLWEKGKYEEAKAAGKNYKVTEKMVERIIDTMTPEEKEWADIAFKEYYNGMSPAEGNKTSLAIDGWERFIKKNYYRIITDENYTQTVFDSLINDSTIEGQGMLKERVKGAHNPILLVDAFEALDSHIDGMSKYVGLAAPIRNFMKVYNYNDGDVSVKAALNERMGLAGKNYIKKYITDLQGGGKKSGDGRVMSKIRSGYAGSTLTLNPGVVFMQSASLPTAASYLGFGNVIKGLARKVDAETVKKYSVYYRYRSKGNYTADFDDLTKNKTMLDKMPLFNWIQQMDNATVRKLWGACECYVEEHFPNLKKGSEEYLVQVGKTLDKCVSLTQPNYTTAERPEILRSDNELVKSLTMFKTQPLQNFNLVLEAVRNVFFKAKAYRNARKEGRTGRKEKEELKKARKGLAQTIGAVTVAAVMIAAIRGASEMLKGRWENFVDENGEFSLEGLFNYMGKETGGSLAGSVIGGNELYSFISSMIDENSNYYDVSAPQLSVINDFTTAIKNVYDVFSAVSTGDKSPKALFRSAEKLAETIATMFGIPVANARKYVCGIIGNFSPEFKAEYEDLMYGVDLGDVKNASGEGWGSWLFGGMADTDAYFNKYFENRNGKGIKTEYRDEIKRLLTDYKEITGDVNGMFLSDPDKYTYNGITYELKQDDKDAIRQMAQAEASANINALMGKRAFAGLTDEQKIKAIKEINSLAAENAKNQWLSDHNQSVDKGKDFDKVSYAIFKASVNDDMTSAEKKQKLLDLNFNDYATASVYAKAFETKSTKEENTIAYKMEHSSKSAAEIIRESLKEKTEKEKTAAETVDNTAATKIKEAEGYTLPNYKASTLQSIADMGISPEDYAYVSDRVDGHEDKVDYIKGLPFDKTTQQSLVDDLIMGDKAHSKMQVAEDDYNIPSSVYIDTYMFGYESTGSKKERNQKIEDYVNSLPGLNDSQKEYLYWANQVYRKKDAVGGGEEEASGSGSSGSGKRSSGGRRRSSGRRSSGSSKKKGSGSSGSSGTDSGTVPKVTVKAAPSISRKSVSGIAKTSISKYIARNLKAQTEAQRNADYATQVKNIDNNVFMTAKQKAAAKKRLKAAFGK